MLTWSREGKNTRGIAEIIGGNNDRRIIYVNPDLVNPNFKLMEEYQDEFDGDFDVPVDEFDFQVKKKLYNMPGNMTKQRISQVERKTEREFKNIIGGGKKFILNELENSKLRILPNIHRNDIISMFGSAGSGKSTKANEYGLVFRSIFPDNPIYMFSRFEKDDSIDDEKLGLERIKIDKNLITYPMDYKDLMGSLVMMDDIDGIENLFLANGKKGKEAGKLLSDKILGIQNDIIRLGREHIKGEQDGGIYNINIRHKLFDRNKTETLINGSTAIVIFPKGLNPLHVNKFLKDFVGADKDLTAKLKSLRWFIYHQQIPRYVMSDKFIQLI